ncbi:hypothetical protein FB451DRAFT_1174205 [Mycena latifolia]|nr:hypothetical protein FB451DRAFT_1174205 [Mycena latifolia]
MNEASDRVSDAEAARPVLEVYRGERLHSPSSVGIGSSAVPRRNWMLEIGVEKVDAPSAASPKMGGMPVKTARGVEFWGEYRTYPGFWGGLQLCPGYGPRLWQYPVGTRVEAASGDGIRARARVQMGAEDESAGTDESCCIGGRRRRVVPPSGVDTVAVVVREAATDEPRLGKFPYADS